MEFKNRDEMIDYIEENSVHTTEELPYCTFCDERLDSYDGYIEYYNLETDSGYEMFCCEDHMIQYLEKFIKEE